MHDIVAALESLSSFKGNSFRSRVNELENGFAGATPEIISGQLNNQKLTEDLLVAALLIKHNSSQINEIIHTLGILLALPRILEDGEIVESISLAAGNTGKGFDLETSKRIAEFTFIEWQGGPEVIRQNKVFKDFYFLAEEETHKQRELYAIGTEHVMAFLRSGRGIQQILSGNAKLGNDFRSRYGTRFATVRDYYETRKNAVAVRDIRDFITCMK